MQVELKKKKKEKHLGAARQDGLAGEQLRKDAPGAPEVDADTVVRGAKEELWRAVPQRDHPAGHRPRAARVERGGEAKVRDLEHPLVVEEEVGALDVAVQDAAGVAVCQPREQLPHVALHLPNYINCARMNQSKFSRMTYASISVIERNS